MDYVLILFVNDIFAVIILISCSILGIIIIIYFQFYYITAIAALPEGAHGVLRNVVNLVDIIRLILIIFWVSSPSKSSYCGTSVTTAPSLSVGQWRRCSWVSSESSHLRHWVVFSPTLKLLLTSSILDRAVNVNCFSLIEKLLWLDCRYDWSFSSLCLTLLDFEWDRYLNAALFTFSFKIFFRSDFCVRAISKKVRLSPSSSKSFFTLTNLPSLGSGRSYHFAQVFITLY